MSEAAKNKISARIIKAEIRGNHEEAEKLRRELASIGETKCDNLEKNKESKSQPSRGNPDQSRHGWRKPNPSRDEYTQSYRGGSYDRKVQIFLKSTDSLSSMFEQEKASSTTSDEARMFIKTAAKFSREDLDTYAFSSEIDNSQQILNKSKRRKQNHPGSSSKHQSRDVEESSRIEHCDRCKDNLARHLVIHNLTSVFLALPVGKPFMSSKSNVHISNIEHIQKSFVSSDEQTQFECEKYIRLLRSMWKAEGYRCIIMELYLRDRRPSNKLEFTSCGDHFHIQCLPIKDKHFERARMSFKQALQDCEQEWSMNKKLLVTDGRRIQRLLPKGLSYFWVCFDELTNGFGHVIEDEREFSRFFGLEVLSSLLDKDFNPMRLSSSETYREEFERARDFRLQFIEHYNRHANESIT